LLPDGFDSDVEDFASDDDFVSDDDFASEDFDSAFDSDDAELSPPLLDLPPASEVDFFA
jgi:hypothetical protein